MAKVHALRRRIKSVKNINQITKAMEMVAASKLRRAQEATFRSRQYAVAARELLGQLRRLTSPAAHPLFAIPATSGKRLVIVISSDRGLAGAYNSNIFKVLLPLLPNRQAGLPTKLIVIGQKGAQFVSRLPEDKVSVLGVYPTWSAELAAEELAPIVTTVLTQYQAGEVDEVSVVFTDYVSSLQQTVTTRTLLPINPADVPEDSGWRADDDAELLFEPSPEAVLQYIVPRFLEVQLYQAYLEAVASEQSMRMVAMKNASDNASEITDDLTLIYNGARQAAITQELAEITAGADAIA
jgi:F-type H+-transporting ATPase subunit gamma